MMGAALAFTVMLMFVKMLRVELSSFEIITWRGLLAAPIAGLLALRVGLRPHNPPVLLLRSVLGFGGMALYFIAIKGLPVAELTLISRLQPMLVAAMAPLFLGTDERVSWKVWALLGVGLAGCAVLVAPSFSAGGAYGLVALTATGLAAGAHLCLRPLGRSDDPRVVVFWFQVIMLCLAVLGTLLESGRLLAVPSIGLVPAIIGAGLASVVGQLLLTLAYRADRAAVVSAAEYTALLWALLADLLVFSVLPSASAVLGGALVMGSGIALIFVRERPRPLPGLEG